MGTLFLLSRCLACRAHHGAIVVEVIDHGIGVDEVEGRQLGLNGLTLDGEGGVVVLFGEEGDRQGVGAIDGHAREDLALVPRGVCVGIQTRVQVMPHLLDHDASHGLAVGTGQPVGIEVHGGLRSGAAGTEGALGALQLGVAAQLHMNAQAALVDIVLQLLEGGQPLGGGLCVGLRAAQDLVHQRLRVRPRQHLRHGLLGLRSGLQRGLGDGPRSGCGQLQMNRLVHHIRRARAIKHEALLQGHEGAGFALAWRGLAQTRDGGGFKGCTFLTHLKLLSRMRSGYPVCLLRGVFTARGR